MGAAEIWLPVGTTGQFEISDHGRIRCRRTGRIKPLSISASGYHVVNLYAGGIQSVRNVHSIVAEAFIGPRPHGAMVVHRDGNRLNDRKDNLVYRPLSSRKPRDGRPAAEHAGKLTPDAVKRIRARVARGAATADLAREYGVSAPLVSSIKHGRKWLSAANRGIAASADDA